MTMNMVMTTVKMMMVVVKMMVAALKMMMMVMIKMVVRVSSEQRQGTWRLVMRMAMLILRMKMVGMGIIRMTRMGMMRDEDVR